MKWNKENENQRGTVIQRERNREIERITYRYKLCYASEECGQLDSVILCVARFKNFNSQTAVQLSAQTMRPAYENSRVFCCAKLLPACCKPKASRLAAVCQAAWQQQINFVFHLFSVCFFNWFPCLSPSLSLSFAATKCLPYSERSACCCCRPHWPQPRWVRAKLRARITCLHFQKVDRPKPPLPSSPVVDHHLLVNSFGRLVRFVCEISQIFQLSRWF